MSVKHTHVTTTERWEPFPIDAKQILAGDPAARVHWLHVSGEGEPTYYAGLWTAEPSTFTWSYDGLNEMAHFLAGRVRIGVDGGPAVEYRAGDVVYFPKGTRTVWEVVEPIKKAFVDVGQ